MRTLFIQNTQRIRVRMFNAYSTVSCKIEEIIEVTLSYLCPHDINIFTEINAITTVQDLEYLDVIT